MKFKKFKKVRKSFLSVLLVLTMLAGMLPLSVISANAAVKETDDFAKAFTFADRNNLVNQHYGNDYTAYLVSNAVRDCGYTAYVSANSNSTSTTSSQISKIPGVTTLTNPSYSSLNDGYTYIVFGNSSYSWFSGIYQNGTMICNFQSSGVTKSTSYRPGLSVAYKHVTTTVTDDTQNVGDEFYAYINVVGNYYNYGKMLSVDPKQHLWQYGPPSLSEGIGTEFPDTQLVIVDTPNYSDTKQIWKFTRTSDTDGCYYLVQNVATKWYLNVYRGGNYNVCLTEGNGAGASNYKWAFYKKTNAFQIPSDHIGTYGLRPKSDSDSRELHVYGTSNDNVRAETLANDYDSTLKINTGGNAQFMIQKINEVKEDTAASLRCRYDLDSRKNNTCVAVADGETNVNYQSYDIYNPDAISSMTWEFKRVGTSFPPIYNVIHKKTGKYLQVGKENVYTDNITVGVSTNTDDSGVSYDKGQQWLLLGEDSSRITFVSVYYSCFDDSSSEEIKRKFAFWVDDDYRKDRHNNTSVNEGLIPVDRDKDVVLSMDTPFARTAVGDNVQCGANNFHPAQKFQITYEAVNVDYGDFYSPLVSCVDKSSEAGVESYAFSLSKDGKDENGNLTEDNAEVRLRRATKNPAADQQWYFKSLGDGTYAIQNMANGYYLYDSVYKAENQMSGAGLKTSKTFDASKNSYKFYLFKEPPNDALPGVQYYTLRCKGMTDYVFECSYEKIEGDEDKIDFCTANHSVAQGWKITETNTTSPAWGENLGDTFWAYVSPVNYSNKYLHCSDTSDTQLLFETIDNDEAKRKQENYWKFERNADGSYTISSCNLQVQELDCAGAFNTTTDSRKVMVHVDKAFDDSNGIYNHRWFIRKYADGYRLESKMTGQVVTITKNSETNADEAKAEWLDTSNSNQLLNIIKTDLSVVSDFPNVKMRLFNYGKAINDADGAVLKFFNGSEGRNESHPQHYVDTYGASIAGADYKPVMSKTLDSNGYPVVSEGTDTTNDSILGTGSLRYLFDDTAGDSTGFVQGKGSVTSYNLPTTDYANIANYNNYQSQCFTVNNPSKLFKKNSNNGLYYYNSLLNAAYFQRDTDSSGKQLSKGNFKLYDYTMTVPYAGSSKQFYYNADPTTITGLSNFTGNFYPFNIAHEECDVSYGSTDDGEVGNRMKVTSDETKASNNSDYIQNIANDYVAEDSYVPVNYKMDASTAIDCWFGMTAEFEFEQTNDGKYNGKEMQFNFKGDDDVWVYIDDVLVIDIGGTHAALEGTINFATGAVKYPTDTTGNYRTTDLKTLFTEAQNENSSVSLADFDTSGTINANTFAAGTKHTMKLFYLERGGSVSSCAINFNLPKGTPSVTKEVTNTNSELTYNTKYKFKIAQQSGESLGSDITYTLVDADGSSSETEELGTDGIFYLKDGQTAYFHGINNGTSYSVTEYDVQTVSAEFTKFNGSSTTTSELTGTMSGNNYVVNSPENVQTNITQDIKFKNTLSTKSLTIDKDVVDAKNVAKDSMPDSIYNFGLRVYKNNNNGTTTEYGTIDFSIKGTSLANGKKIDNLPADASYDLWEYYPTDYYNRYDTPKFVDSDNPDTTVVGRLVEASNTPAKNDVITGTINDNTVTVTNKLLDNQKITLTIKYYDRKVVSGEVANIDEQETAFSKQVELNSSNATFSGNKITSIDLAKIITDTGVSLSKAVNNVVDDYSLPTSQQSGVNAVKGKTYTWGKDDLDSNGINFASHKITEAEAVYHTNSKRQPINDLSKQEKWVTYYQSGTAVDAEASTFIDFDKLTNITIWLYNEPHKYTVTTHVPDGTSQNGKTIYFEGYYNQVLGSYRENTNNMGGTDEYSSEYEFFCDTYSIPQNEYDARGYTIDAGGNKSDKTYNSSGAADTFGDKDFSHWTDGTNVISTHREYHFRISQDIDLYAQYGTVEKGILTTNNGIDTYYTSDGVEKLRLNTVMNPYGFKYGIDKGNQYITETAVAYLTLNENGKSISSFTQDQSDEISTQIYNKLNSGDWSYNASTCKCTLTIPEVTVKVDGTPKNIGSIVMIAYKLNDKNSTIQLTNRNRIQFVANYTASTNRGRKIVAFTSLKYDEPDNTKDNKWYVSSNFATHEFTNSVKTSAFSGNTVWADANPSAVNSALSLVKMYKNSDSEYSFYLPDTANLSSLPLYYSGYNSVKIGDQQIKIGARYSFVEGQPYNLYLNGTVSGTLTFYKSSTPTLYLQTAESFPVTTKAVNSNGVALSHKDNYSTSGTYATSENGTFTEGTVKKLKGRGNGSWSDSYNHTGKYSYNITIKEKNKSLFSKLNVGTKYCLLANNADEAFLRNTTAFTLANKLGLAYTPSFQYVDVYDNGDYMGSYLVTDKIEINSQSVDLDYNFDDLNEDANTQYDDLADATRKSSTNNINDSSTSGYTKWVELNDPADVDITNGVGSYLLEVEFASRFPDEISGFISTKGQPVVVKTPEYATEKQINYISNWFNQAEAAIYNSDSTLADIEKYIDVDSFIKAYLIQELSKNIDACNSSFYIYYNYNPDDANTDKKLHAGPVWDYDNTFGQFKQDGRTIIENSIVTGETIKSQYQNADGWMASIKGMDSHKEILDFEAMLLSHGEVWDRLRKIWNGSNNDGFYSKAKAYVNGDANTEGTLAYYLKEVEKCGAMNESRWNFIAKDLLSNRYDTGDTIPVASAYFKGWLSARLDWLNDGTIPTGNISTGSLTNLLPLGTGTTITNLGLTQVKDPNKKTSYIYKSDTTNGQFDLVTYDKTYNDTAFAGAINAVIGETNTDSNHKWTFEYDSSDGTYKIKDGMYNKYLTAFWSIKEDGSLNAIATNHNGSDSQKWYILKDNSGNYILKPKSSNAVLYAPGTTSGSNVLTSKYDTSDAKKSAAQKFSIKDA